MGLTAGRKLDLRTYRDGIIDAAGGRRPIRIGFDVGCLVAKVAHEVGSAMLDERHLTNYGRFLLQEEEEAGALVTQVASLQAMLTSSEGHKREYVDRCAGYIVERIQVLGNASGGQILVVFDGATPPIRGSVSKQRSDKDEAPVEKQSSEPLATEEEAIVNIKKRVPAACHTGAGCNHGDIVCEVLQALRRAEIPFLVAPYEAEGQLAYMAERGMIDLVVTENSNLIAQGCQSILFHAVEELGKGNASGTLVQREDLSATALHPESLWLLDFSDVMLAVMFVALGCDYCSSLRQISSVAARDIVGGSFLGEQGQSKEECDRPALEKVFEKLYRQTSEKDLTDEFKAGYEASFLAALLMYRHPMIYDPFLKRYVLFRDPPHCSDPELMDYEPYAELCSNVERREQILGTCHGSITSTHIAEGWISPRTKCPYKDMIIPARVLDEISSRASDMEVEHEVRAEIQDVPSTPSGNNSQVATVCPDTQDASHFETQMETNVEHESSSQEVHQDMHEVTPRDRESASARLASNVMDVRNKHDGATCPICCQHLGPVVPKNFDFLSKLQQTTSEGKRIFATLNNHFQKNHKNEPIWCAIRTVEGRANSVATVDGLLRWSLRAAAKKYILSPDMIANPIFWSDLGALFMSRLRYTRSFITKTGTSKSYFERRKIPRGMTKVLIREEADHRVAEIESALADAFHPINRSALKDMASKFTAPRFWNSVQLFFTDHYKSSPLFQHNPSYTALFAEKAASLAATETQDASQIETHKETQGESQIMETHVEHESPSREVAWDQLEVAICDREFASIPIPLNAMPLHDAGQQDIFESMDATLETTKIVSPPQRHAPSQSPQNETYSFSSSSSSEEESDGHFEGNTRYMEIRNMTIQRNNERLRKLGLRRR